jgi:Family of unknown function (DUF5681)
MKASTETQPQNRQNNRRGKRELHPAMIAHQFKPGQSGNPGGRPKSKPFSDELWRQLQALENPKSKKGQTMLQALIAAGIKRALKDSDTLLKEILNRIDGPVVPDRDDKSEQAATVVILDVPRPSSEGITTMPSIGPTTLPPARPAKPNSTTPAQEPFPQQRQQRIDPRPPQ